MSDLSKLTNAEVAERLNKRADEDQECADNSAVVSEALAEQMAIFKEGKGGYNTYAVRLAVDHQNSVRRDGGYAALLREAASRLQAPAVADIGMAEIETVARSDAKCDGRDFDGLGRADKERYRSRAWAGLRALRTGGSR